MKCLITNTPYARFYNIVDEIVTGKITSINGDKGFDTQIFNRNHRLLAGEYKLIPKELENESIEVIKFWAAL